MMTKSLKIQLLTIAILVGISFLITGCSLPDNPVEDKLEEILEEEEAVEDEEVEDDEKVIGNLTAKVNGEDFNASRLIVGPNLGASVSFTNNGYFFAISAIDLAPGLKSNKIIYLAFFDFDFDTVASGLKFDTVNPFTILASEPGAYAIYAEDLNTDDEIDGLGTNTIEEISIEITAIDRQEKLISGKFSFNGTHEDTTTKYRITDGIFKDVTYEIN